MFSLKLSLISLVIALNVINSFCDIHESVNQNKSQALNTSQTIIDSSHKRNQSDWPTAPRIGRIHITNGFMLRTLFVVLVVLISLSLVCMLRVYCWGLRWKRTKASKEWPHPKYDSLPNGAINDSIKKNAFVLNDSDDEEFTIFDANQRLIK